MDTNVPHMLLSLYVDSSDNQLHEAYEQAVASHNAKWVTQEGAMDAGFDLLCPRTIDVDLMTHCAFRDATKIDYQVICRAQLVNKDCITNTGFYLYPRSSLSKTNLRLANSVGIVDAGYRGHLMGMFDAIYRDCDFQVEKFTRQLQICAPSLLPIYVKLVKSKEELGEATARGEGGFGSTGK